MKEKGFVTSALLYGILSLYIVLVMGTVSVIGNRKLANDKIKQSALDDVQNLETPVECFETEPIDSTTDIRIIGYNKENTEYNCNIKNIYIPEKDSEGNKIVEIGAQAFLDKKIDSVTIKPNINSIYCNAFEDNSNVLFIIKGNMPARIISDNCSFEICENGVCRTLDNIWGATNSSIRQD